MIITEVRIEVDDLAGTAEFFAGALGLPATRHRDLVLVQAGRTVLRCAAGPSYEGAHHLDF